MTTIDIVQLPGKGRGYVANQDIAAGTTIHVSLPLATTVSQEWTPETCLWCFDFSYPKKQKTKALSPDDERALLAEWGISRSKKQGSVFKDMAFCSDLCRDRCIATSSFEWNMTLAVNYRLDREFTQCQTCSNNNIKIPSSLSSPSLPPSPLPSPPISASTSTSASLPSAIISNTHWIDVDNDEALLNWLNDAWDTITIDNNSNNLLEAIEDTDRAMCRLIAACIVRKNNPDSTDPFENLLVIQNNELAHFRSCYGSKKVPQIKNCDNKKNLLLLIVPASVLQVMALYSFFARALTTPVNKVPVLANVNHSVFRSIYFRERANSFGLWEMSDVPDVTDDLELLGWGIYPSAVYFNHSCDANVIKLREGRQIKFIAKRMIERGQEACISYGSVEEDVESRRSRLFSHYHFLCQCTRCIDEDRHNAVIR